MNILHKLGFYKKSEIDELIKSTVNLLGSVDDVIEGANIDRNCYKAAISAFREVNTVEHAVKVISDYCDTTDCIVCKFGGEKCKLAHTAPYDWRD